MKFNKINSTLARKKPYNDITITYNSLNQKHMVCNNVTKFIIQIFPALHATTR